MKYIGKKFKAFVLTMSEMQAAQFVVAGIVMFILALIV